MPFKTDWASLIVGRKYTVFACFYLVFQGNFPSTSPLGAYIWRGNLTEGVLRYRFGGLIFGGAYTWRGLFSEFYGIGRMGTRFGCSDFCDPLGQQTLVIVSQWRRLLTNRKKHSSTQTIPEK